MPDQPTHSISGPEKATLIGARYDRYGRATITHPTVYTVSEDGQELRSFDTKREAHEYIAYLES
jgi:hypothetical protein